MIDEKRLEELRKYDIHAHTSCDDLNECPFACEVIRISTDLLETLSLALQVVRTGLQIEDILEVPVMLGAHSQSVIRKAIDDFRSALAPFAASEGTEGN